MNKILFVLLCTLSIGFVSSCKEEKKSEYIVIDKKIEKPKKKHTIAQDSVCVKDEVKWGDSEYTVITTRKADKSLPIVVDEAADDKYYGNAVTLRVVRSDGSEAISKRYTKDDFKEYIPKGQYDAYTLLTVSMMGEPENDKLQFVVAVGEPDTDVSDNFVNILMKLSKTGQVTLERLEISEYADEEESYE